MKIKTLSVNFSIATLLLVLPFQLFARRGDAPEEKAGGAKTVLAVVAIPMYIDATGSKNYGYLSNSVTEAVNASMQQKFDYARADQKSVDAQAQRLWKPNRVPADPDVRQIATATNSDYVIVGSYSLSANKKQIIFNTRVFIAPGKFIDVPPFANNADATLFDVTNKVATEIVKAIEADAIAQANAKQEKIKEGEKIALSKTEEPKSAPATNDASRNSDRYLRAGAGYNTNTVERHTQFYQYQSSATNVEVDLRITPGFLIYGKFVFPQTPSGDAIPTTFKNNGNQTGGFEVGDRNGNYVFGMNFRNFSNANPAGIYVRDLANWSISAYMRTHYSLFEVWQINFGLDLDSYLDVYQTKATFTSGESTGRIQWNVESALNVSHYFSVLGASLTGIVGTSFSLLDNTGAVLITSAAGTSAYDKTNRNFSLVGVRYGAELIKWFYGVTLKAEGYFAPSVHGNFQPVDTQNVKRTSYGFIGLSASYRLGF